MIIKLEDIKSVKTKSGFRKFNSIVIESRTNRDKSSSKRIEFPVSWFGKENIKTFIQSLSNSNTISKKIIIDVVF